MITELTCAQFAFTVIIPLLSGASGAGIVLTAYHFARKKWHSKSAKRFELRNNWQKISHDEQMYNGR